MLQTTVVVLGTIAFGAFSWTFAEYVLHRFAMHHMHGKGIMSREHLSHHVRSSWDWDPTTLLSWAGVLVVGYGVLAPLGWVTVSVPVGVALGTGWTIGYFHYELQHALAHRRGPGGRYTEWARIHHFHHHFGHPMANHGVTLDLWDRVFGTLERPERVRVPRRLAMPWLFDEDGELRADLRDRYELVGVDHMDERQAKIDQVRAFASLAPTD